MGRRKRVSGAARQGVITENATQVIDEPADGSVPIVPLLRHMTDGATIEDLNPKQCLPLFLSRDHSENAVCRLAAIINGTANDGNGATLTTLVSGSPSSIVVPLVGDLAPLVSEYFISKFESENGCTPSEEMLREAISEFDVWYGIIDGCQLHGAILMNMLEFPAKWSSFNWRLLVVRPIFTLDEYRKLSIVQNEMNRQVYHYESTLYDLLRILRDIYDAQYAELYKLQRRSTKSVQVRHKDVAHQYDDGDHDKNTFVKQAVSVASRLSRQSIEAIGTVVNSTCEEIILNTSQLNSHNLKSTQAVMANYDCRLYRKFLCTSTLRGAIAFMSAVKDGHEDAQVNSIYRAQHWSASNDFRSLKPDILSKQFTLAKKALQEESKFLQKISSSSWPDGMHTTRDNLLRSTVFDSELESNSGNDHDVLSEIWRSFVRCHPAEARALNGQIPPQIIPAPAPPLPPVLTTEATETTEEERKKRLEEQKRIKEQEEKRKEKERRRMLCQKADKHLNDGGIQTYPMSFSDFLRDKWTSSSSRVDLVLSCLPTECDSESLKKLPAFCKAVLKTGSYVFLIVTEQQFLETKKEFSDAGFKVCEHSFKIMYDPRTMKRRRTVDFPQRHGDISLIAKTQGCHPSGFQPDFATDIDSGTHSIVQFASILNANACSDKLMEPKSNTPLYPDERSIDLFASIIRLFCPAGGGVLDPMAGPLTTSLACLRSARRCVSIHGLPTVRVGLGRLRIHAMPDARMEHLDTFIDLTSDDENEVNVTTTKESMDTTTTGSDQLNSESCTPVEPDTDISSADTSLPSTQSTTGDIDSLENTSSTNSEYNLSGRKRKLNEGGVGVGLSPTIDTVTAELSHKSGSDSAPQSAGDYPDNMETSEGTPTDHNESDEYQHDDNLDDQHGSLNLANDELPGHKRDAETRTNSGEKLLAVEALVQMSNNAAESS